ncbi:hypothetical protein [Burkholderia ubonensis]|nr:hypothetical protein [Burkholderia ubonensis]
MSKKMTPFARSPKNDTKTSTPAPAQAAVEAFLEQSAMVGRTPAANLDESSVYRTVNVKLNKRRYTSLKLISTVTEKAMQQYLAEAVDEIIERHKHLLPDIKTR